MRAVILDLDGTLVDTVYGHALSWWQALNEVSGGYGEQELAQAGAYRVYQDPAELLASIYQLGLRGGA